MEALCHRRIMIGQDMARYPGGSSPGLAGLYYWLSILVMISKKITTWNFRRVRLPRPSFWTIRIQPNLPNSSLRSGVLPFSSTRMKVKSPGNMKKGHATSAAARTRENQRHSRSRRKEYVQHLVEVSSIFWTWLRIQDVSVISQRCCYSILHCHVPFKIIYRF